MKCRFSVSPWAALAAALLFYISDGRTLSLFLLPVFFHELGHWLVLRLFGCRVTELRWELSGLCIRYAGDPGLLARVFSALAGPLAGLLYALIAARFGPSGELSAGISLLLSLFNLIPAQPLDGGRAAEALLRPQAARTLSLFSSLGAAALGIYFFTQGRGAALALAGMYLLSWQVVYGSSSAISPD